ncbi:OprO/OprP family phosphate-selective porin [Qipengyuania flava]|uniref:OprO/OprP family phosphate-selective porin n=1 Tax=Qipengyuania flava TaxID=192812 RepID=UPI00141B4F2A|nr:porin [Qipengyuania flava]NIJ61008.1 phosphate-selective porin OprO/OprP [Qipengyuania flava]
MHRTTRLSLMAAALSCTMSTPLLAQDVTLPADELAAMRAQLAAMNARIDQLEGELAATKAEAAEAGQVVDAPAPAADSEPVSTLAKSDGWSFKPRGRLMFDAGFTNAPDSTGASDGFGNEVRRARLGASGDMPGGFGYKFEVDFAGNEISVADAILSYENGPVEIAIGQHNNFQSLEELTSSLHTTFIERAAFTDAFGFERRLGASVTYARGDFLAQAGIFTDNLEDTDSKNRGADARIVLMPRAGDTQLHFGSSFHYNDLDDPAAQLRYRQRPLVHFTSQRFIDTRSMGANSETGYGLEAAAIAGRFHAAAEGYWQSVDMPGVADDPTFFGGYFEAGVFLTDDTRGYKGGKFDRTKPSSPVGEGGIGSVQFTLRYDHLDLNDAGILGGRQAGYFAALVWKPTEYTALMLNYGHLQYKDAILPTASGDTSYGVDAIGMRAQIDF